MDEALKLERLLRDIIHMFDRLSSIYGGDEYNFTTQLHAFKDFLVKVNAKYPALEIYLQEEDVTHDDLKIFFTQFKTKKQLEDAFPHKPLPVMVEVSERYQKLQALVVNDVLGDYDDGLDFVAAIGIRGMKKNPLRIPATLKALCYGKEDYKSQTRKIVR